MYYPTIVQPKPTEAWSNAYPIHTQQQQQTIPAIYYQMPTVTTTASAPTTTVVEGLVSQQPVPIVYYQTPTARVNTTQEQPPTTSTTTVKTTTARVLNRTHSSTNGETSAIEEAKTNLNVTNSEISTTQANPLVTTSKVVETTTLDERALSSSTSSCTSTNSSQSTETPQPEMINQPTVLPPQIPIQTTNILPMRRIIHRTHRRPRTPTGYYSSDLDYRKRKVYKTDSKYRHYYCFNWCKGRCDLRNRSYACCEWFYGCPLWGLIFCLLFFLGLIITFFTLFGLQPTINSSRFSDTAKIVLLNRTEIIYGFYNLCGYQTNATSDTPTTLILCTNTATTSTARIELSPFYTVISEANSCSRSKIFIFLVVYMFYEIFKIGNI